jgi:hypothetical protein
LFGCHTRNGPPKQAVSMVCMKSVIWPRANHANLDAIFWVPPRETVKAVKAVAAIEIVARALAIDGEYVRLERDVDGTPPDIFSEAPCLTTRLSLGERPVLTPEYATSASCKDSWAFASQKAVHSTRWSRIKIADFRVKLAGGVCRLSECRKFGTMALWSSSRNWNRAESARCHQSKPRAPRLFLHKL